MKREELEAKAKELGIDFDEDTDDEELAKKVNDALDDDDDDDDDDPEKLKEKLSFKENEAKKAFEARDREKRKRRKMQEELDSLKEKFGDLPDPDEIKSIKEEYEELKKFKKEQEKRRKEEEEKNMSEVEKLQARLESVEKNYTTKLEEERKRREEIEEQRQKELEQTKKHVHQLRAHKLETEIMKHATKYNAWSPEQIVRLTKPDFIYDEDLDEFFYYKKNDKGKKEEVSVKDYVQEFLTAPENENLVKSEANPNSFHAGGQHDKKGKKKEKGKEDSKYDPEDPEIIKKADRSDMTPERYIKTLEIKDEKMAKIEANREKLNQ